LRVSVAVWSGHKEVRVTHLRKVMLEELEPAGCARRICPRSQRDRLRI